MNTSAPDDRSTADNTAEHPDQNRLRGGLHVRYEFVVLDGEAGKHLARRQAAIMRRVLQHIAGLQEGDPKRQS